MMEDSSTVEQHWYSGETGALLKRIDAALQDLGKNPHDLTAHDLATVDEFHIRGREATEELAELAGLDKNTSVVDVGSGIGGPSRYIADRYGCSVTGIDLTAEYCDTANVLAQRVGLANLVQYQQANALALPFEPESFDLAWTQHISMNVSDKLGMFKEMARVVKSDGRIVIYDPIAGNGEALHFPVPWSRDSSFNFLVNTHETQELLESAGLVIETWNDVSKKCIAWFEKNAASGNAPPVLGIHLLLGSQWPAMAANMVKNISEEKLAVVQIVARKA